MQDFLIVVALTASFLIVVTPCRTLARNVTKATRTFYQIDADQIAKFLSVEITLLIRSILIMSNVMMETELMETDVHPLARENVVTK